MDSPITLSHRLVLPGDANHHGTLFAGSLMQISLEAAYATACRTVGRGANLVLRRVLTLECYHPVPVGTLIELQGIPLHMARAYLVIGLVGTPLEGHNGPWMDALFGFAQIDSRGRATPFPDDMALGDLPGDGPWVPLQSRLSKLLKLKARKANGKDAAEAA
jgi:acyl-CoA hydrolase